MKTHLFAIAAATLALTLPASAQDEPDPRSSSEAVAPTKTPAPSPNQIVDAASQDEWVQIPAEDLLVMTLAPDAEGDERTVVIQLMPAPFSQGWVSNIRTLARAKWYDGITVNRVQDNYVVQWGDPGHDNPESGETETKPLPEGLNVMVEEDYASETPWALRSAAVA
ncbi:MAG: peptidylprolyl isomerase, partial [Pseudomonadota bacterium]